MSPQSFGGKLWTQTQTEMRPSHVCITPLTAKTHHAIKIYMIINNTYGIITKCTITARASESRRSHILICKKRRRRGFSPRPRPGQRLQKHVIRPFPRLPLLRKLLLRNRWIHNAIRRHQRAQSIFQRVQPVFHILIHLHAVLNDRRLMRGNAARLRLKQASKSLAAILFHDLHTSGHLVIRGGSSRSGPSREEPEHEFFLRGRAVHRSYSFAMGWRDRHWLNHARIAHVITTAAATTVVVVAHGEAATTRGSDDRFVQTVLHDLWGDAAWPGVVLHVHHLGWI